MKLKHILLGMLLLMSLRSCKKYLDVIPEGQATLEDMFRSETECQKFVQYLYHNIPTHGHYNWMPDMYAGDDMLAAVKGTTRWYTYKSILFNEENANSTYYGLWSTTSSSPTGRTNYEIYNSLRYCYLLLERIDGVPNISPENLKNWKGMAYFLIAYYHQVLMDNYGPVVLIRRNTPQDASEGEMYPARSTYDECVTFVVENWDKAAEMLPARWPESQIGYATSIAAKAYKARLLLTAASPLYNGNSIDYANFKNTDGTILINQTYDPNKWEKAMKAAKEAIDLAEANGYRLYTNPSPVPISEFDQAVKNYHDAFCETVWNPNEYFFAGASQTAIEFLQRDSGPRQSLPYSTDGFRNFIAPSMEAVEMYYTKNGLPLNVDPLTKDKNLYTVEAGDSTALLHRNREPRFYANVGYDRGTYDIGGKTIILKMRGGEINGSTLKNTDEYQSPSGYLNKKFIHKELNYDKTTKTYSYRKFVFPFIRLAELYMNYAEADFERNGSLSSESLIQLNKIRKRSGLPNFETSWAIVGGIPEGEQLRKVIHQERSIEFLGEGRRYYDMRRWKIANEVMNKQPKAWTLDGKTKEAFYRLALVPDPRERVFNAPKSNWLAIPLEQLNINYRLVQNPGY